MLSFRIATRFLRKSPVQTVFIILGVTVGIGVQVFVGSLITSLQDFLLDQTLGSSPHLTIFAEEDGEPIVYDGETQDVLEGDERISAIVPERVVSVIYTDGTDTAPLNAKGGDPAELDSIYGLEDRMVEGSFADMSDDALLVGLDFAEEFGLAPGDPLEFVLPDGTATEREVAGVYDLGNAAVNETLAFSGEGFPAEVAEFADDEYNSIELQLFDVFESTAVAADLADELGEVTITDWQVEQADLLEALASQSVSSYMIQVFVVIAVAIGIASVLAVSAIQKTQQVGILKALGMRDGQTGTVFLWQGLLVGLFGTAGGIAVGLGLVLSFSAFAGDAAFPVEPRTSFIVISAAVGLGVAMLSTIIPYRRTARLDPIEVIQGG
jgi:lipoprotein-releasing system permease protein